MVKWRIPKMVAVLLQTVSWGSWSVPQSAAQDERTESRPQAVLRLTGTFLPDGGYKITAAPTQGPGANLDLPNAATPTRGILEVGDIITEIDGNTFRDHREFLDRMNDAYRANNGNVRITVKDVNTGWSVVWTARPDVVRMDAPVAYRPLDILAELGNPVVGAPPVPTVPATIDP